MKIAVASDHRGYEMKRKMTPLLKRMGHEVKDFGCDGPTGCDYPDFAAPAARAVAEGSYDLGIFYDGGGIGMAMVANKIRTIRAASVSDEVSARRAREHHHCNVVCMGCDLMSEEHVRKIIETFLTSPLGDGRHHRRIAKLAQIEQEECHGRTSEPRHQAHR